MIPAVPGVRLKRPTAAPKGRAIRRVRPAIGVACALLSGASLGCADESAARAALVTGGEAARGSRVIRDAGCGACHTIEGIPGARGIVGPPLSGFAERAYIAGSLTNTPANAVRWIMNPQSIEPGTVMPNLSLTEGQARDVAAYLYALP